MNRRSFLGALVATASGLLIPEQEPVRVYSFAKNLKVPGVEEHVLQSWHRFSISWGGTRSIAKVDDRVVLDSIWPADHGIFFEYDSSVSGNWRAEHSKSPMPEKTVLLVEQGHALVDWWHQMTLATSTAPAPRAIETVAKFADPNARFRLGWGRV